MWLYIAQDDNPDGGYLEAHGNKPDMRYMPKSISEVRRVKFDDELWEWMMLGNIPIDEDDPHSFDHVWAPWWTQAETIWTRPGG